MEWTQLWAAAYVAYGLAASVTTGVAAAILWRDSRSRDAWFVSGALFALAVHYVGMGVDAAIHTAGVADGPFTAWSALGQTGATLAFEALNLFLLCVVTRLLGTGGPDSWTRRAVLAQAAVGSAIAVLLFVRLIHDEGAGASADTVQAHIASLMSGDGSLPIMLFVVGPSVLFRFLLVRVPRTERSPWMRWVAGGAFATAPAASSETVTTSTTVPPDHFRALSGIYAVGALMITLRFINVITPGMPLWVMLIAGLRLLFLPSALAVLYFAARPVFFEAALKHGLLFVGIGGILSTAGVAASLFGTALSPLAVASVVLGASLTIYLVGTAVHFANNWLDRWVFQRPDYAHSLNRLLIDMARCPDPATLRATVATHTADTLGATWARLGRGTEPHSAVAVGIGTPTHVRGFLSVGPRRRGHAYTAADMAFVEAVAAHYLSVVEASHARNAHHVATVAELRALRAQINPHFLFNALTLLAERVQAQPSAERLVLNLAELFRFALESTQHDTVPLRAELAAIEAYLHIEGERFGDRLRWTIDVPESLRNTPIPPMVLQPLVENAIRHGLAGTPNGGTVKVVATQAGARVQLTVADDGAGFTPRGTPERVGLANVRARVQQTGGKWHLRTAPGAGTVITMEVGPQ